MAPKTLARDLTVTTHATQQDALLLVEIFNGPLGLRAADGMSVLWSYDKPPTYEQFIKDHPMGTEENKAVNAVLNVNETIATFVKQGLIDRGLVYDLLWVKGAWDQCKAIALHHRQKAGVAAIYENFEMLAQGQH